MHLNAGEQFQNILSLYETNLMTHFITVSGEQQAHVSLTHLKLCTAENVWKFDKGLNGVK